MATYLRGKSGLVKDLTTQRNKLTNRLGSYSGERMTKTMRARLESEIGVYNQLIGWLGMDDVHILSEAEYDAHPWLGRNDAHPWTEVQA